MQATSRITLSIIIVNYNTEKLLENCLSSIYTNNQDLKPEVFVVDNASIDHSVKIVIEKFPQVKLIENKENLFYSRANNQALALISGKYFLILNTDTIIPNNLLSKLVEFMEKNKDCGLLSCREIDEDGKTIPTCHNNPTPLTEIMEMPIFFRIFKNNRIVSEFRYAGWDRKDIRTVDTIPGSFMFGRKKILQEIGMFDENLPLFYSDADLCRQVKNKGYAIYHLGNYTITHLKAKSLQKFPFYKIMDFAYRDMLRYHKKYSGGAWMLILYPLTKISLMVYYLK